MEMHEIYDSREKIEEFVKDLKTLHEVSKYRYEKYHYDNKMMNRIPILDGFIIFDQCGNTMVKIGRDAYSPINIPDEDSFCSICGKNWSLYNLDDYVVRQVRGEDFEYGIKFYHKKCNAIDRLNDKLEEFCNIFDKVYPKSYRVTVTPNRYCNCDLCAPWFIFSTEDGDIEIGWRKRVIHIGWLSNYKLFTERFENEDVTKWAQGSEYDRYIHAWSIEKCIEYLNRAKDTTYQI